MNLTLLNKTVDFVKTEGFKKYLKNTGWLFVGRVLTLIVAFFVNALVARFLEPSNFGVLSYVVSFGSLFYFVATLGTEGIISRELVRRPEDGGQLLGTTFVIRVVGSIGAMLLSTATTLVVSKDISIALLVFVYSFTFIFSSFNVIDFYFQSKVLAKNTVKVQLVTSLISTVLKIVLIWKGAATGWFVFVYVVESLVMASGLVWIYYKNKQTIFLWKFNHAEARRLLRDSWPMMLSGAAIIVYSRIDQVMIKQFMDTRSVGLYSVAVRLSEVWYFIPSVICTSLFPAIINAKKNNIDLYENRFRKLYFLMVALSVGIALPITVFAPWVIKVLFGSAYFASIPVIRVYVWAGFGMFLGIAVGQYLIAENHTKINFYTTLIGAFSNIALNLWWIPKFGIIGAAYATLVSYILAAFGVLFFKETRRHGFLLVKSIFMLRF